MQPWVEEAMPLLHIYAFIYIYITYIYILLIYINAFIYTYINIVLKIVLARVADFGPTPSAKTHAEVFSSIQPLFKKS